MKKEKKALSLASKFALPVLFLLVVFSLLAIIAIKLGHFEGFPGVFATLFFSRNYLASEHTAYATGQILNNLVAYFFMLSAIVLCILSFVLIKHNKAARLKSAAISLLLFVPATIGLTGGFIDFVGHGLRVFLWDSISNGSIRAAAVAIVMVIVYVLDILYYIAAIIYLAHSVNTAIKVNKGELPVEELEETEDDKSAEEKLREEELEAEKRAALLSDIRKIVKEELDALDRVVIVKEVEAEKPAEKPVEEPAEPEPEPEEEVMEEEEEGGAPSIKSVSVPRVPFAEKIVKADKEIQEKYNELKNEILAYGASSRISIAGDTFRLHRKAYVKITLVGKTLKVYFALDPRNYVDSPIPVLDVSDKSSYEEVPALLKVKSNLSVRRAKELIASAFAVDGVEKEQEAQTHNYVKDIRAELKAKKQA